MHFVTPIDVKTRLDANEPLFLLDVRTEEEYEHIRLDKGELHIPLHEIAENLGQLPQDKTKEIIVYCRVSPRAYEAQSFLNACGYTNVFVMEGGIMRWFKPLTK